MLTLRLGDKSTADSCAMLPSKSETTDTREGRSTGRVTSTRQQAQEATTPSEQQYELCVTTNRQDFLWARSSAGGRTLAIYRWQAGGEHLARERKVVACPARISGKIPRYEGCLSIRLPVELPRSPSSSREKKGTPRRPCGIPPCGAAARTCTAQWP